MRTIRIYDEAQSVLSVHLHDVLKLLSPRALQASWTVKAVDAGYRWFDATGAGGELLEDMAESKETVSGYTLAKAASDTLQVIWGEFSASLPEDPDETWVVVRAIDSAFLEITTSDDDVIRRMKSKFNDIRHYESPWKQSSGQP